jgi:hypothetical protein
VTEPLQSLTLVLEVSDLSACLAELVSQRASLERGWAALPGLQSACLAALPGAAGASAALLLEFSFEGDLAAFTTTLFANVGAELNALLRHCEGRRSLSSARELTTFFGAEARRADPLGEARQAPPLSLRRWLFALCDRVRLLASTGSQGVAPMSAGELEERRSAVGLQEWYSGVPLLHSSWLLPEPSARDRVKRALRDLERSAAPRGRFLLVGQRLLFLAYPGENPLLYSERLSHAACFDLARVWGNTAGFPALALLRRARRERRLQDYLLDYRVPVAAWFKARASSARA